MITRKLIAALMAGTMIVGSAQGTSAGERTWYYANLFIGVCEIIGAPDVIYRVLTAPDIGLKRCDGPNTCRDCAAPCGMRSATDADGDVWVTLIFNS